MRCYGLAHAPGTDPVPYERSQSLAERDLERAFEINPSNGKYLYAQALICEQRGQLDAARAHLQRAAELGYQPDEYVAQRIHDP